MVESRQGRSAIARPLLVGVLVVLVALAYGLPFLGFPLSLLLPVLTHLYRRLLWPPLPRQTSLVVSWVAWLGLWLPALVHLTTGLSLVRLWSIEQSTAWLLIPLCGPVGPWTTIGPAAAAALACLAGLGASTAWRRSWPWVVAAWAAPWVHQVTLLLLPEAEFVC